jgi:hypothetical protein
LKVVAFSNQSKEDKKLLKKFVRFPWELNKSEPNFIPLLDYEYLGFKPLGVIGFFEPQHFFFRHAEMRFFLVYKNDELFGRCLAFVNHNHNKHWQDKTGFFGHFEAKNDQEVTNLLIESSQDWLKSQGMDTIRGPQNMPVNEATPGIMTDGFKSRPVIYYNYNQKYYQNLLLNAGFKPIKRVFSWEVSIMNPMEERLVRVAKKVMERYDISVEGWDERPFDVRKKEMFDIYNNAWENNFGFIPFTEEEFDRILKDMKIIMDKRLFLFLYVKGKIAAFFGGVPNLFDKLKPLSFCRRCELLRVSKMFLTKSRIKGYRLGYLGVKKKYQRLGLDSVLIWKQKIFSQKAGFEYSDIGWILEDNTKTIRLVEMMAGKPSKTYTIFQKEIK